MIYLTVQSRGAPNDALSNPHKDSREDAFEVALEGALEVTVGMYLRFHLLIQ